MTTTEPRVEECDAPALARVTTALVDSPFFEREVGLLGLSAADEQLMRRFRRDGYLIVEDLLDDHEVDALVAEVQCHFEEQAGRTGTVPARIQDLWESSALTRDLAVHPRIMALLRMLYRREPVPFQTLTFPVGTQQGAHSDTIHFNARPSGFMCGVWVALEDVTLDNGPLFYHPGSHRLPEIDLQDLWYLPEPTADPTALYQGPYRDYELAMTELMEINGLPAHRLAIPKGTGLVWAANLVHGGSPILTSGASRWSQVSHYFFEGCVYYTPLLSSAITGELFLRSPVHIGTGQVHHPTWNGVPISVHQEGPQARIAVHP